VEILTLKLFKFEIVVVITKKHTVLCEQLCLFVEITNGFLPALAACELGNVVPRNNYVLNTEALKEVNLALGIIVKEIKNLMNGHALEVILVKQRLNLLGGLIVVACKLYVLVTHFGKSLESSFKISSHGVANSVKLNTNVKLFHFISFPYRALCGLPYLMHRVLLK
jgi:hypothetical protein